MTTMTDRPKERVKGRLTFKHLKIEGLGEDAPRVEVDGLRKDAAAPEAEAPTSAEQAGPVQPATPDTGADAPAQKPETAHRKGMPRGKGKKRPPIVARTGMLRRADDLAGLLIQRPGVLVSTLEDVVKPWKVGIRLEIEALRRPDVDVGALRRALWRYVNHTAYQLALAQAGAMRHRLDGEAVEPVSDEDRKAASTALLAAREWRKTQVKGSADEAPPEAAAGESGGPESVETPVG